MSYTRAQLVNKALGKLSVIAEGQAPSAGDVAKMDGIVDAAMSLLGSLDIYVVSDYGQAGPTGGSIEPEAYLPLATWLARCACEEFNQQADQKMIAECTMAEAALRTLSRPPRSRSRLGIEAGLRRRSNPSRIWPNNG